MQQAEFASDEEEAGAKATHDQEVTDLTDRIRLQHKEIKALEALQELEFGEVIKKTTMVFELRPGERVRAPELFPEVLLTPWAESVLL
jgi:DNA-binding winged helix-turn-helix (wHTH) protein